MELIENVAIPQKVVLIKSCKIIKRCVQEKVEI